MSGFEFPKNVKQIGSITGSIKIYMEDYVCSYLQQYAAAGGYCERLAVLIGRQMVIDGQKILFISGAVQALYTKQEENIEVFTDETWDYIREQVNTYFEDMEILGWMQSQPGYGVYLNVNYAKYHFDIFNEKHHVLFVTDPIERSSAFFVVDPIKSELTESKGYFIYYDKNINMHEYMLNNKVTKIEFKKEIDEDASFQEASSAVLSVEHHSRSMENKRMVNMLVSLSALLLVICFIMGVGLIQNEDRITKLERNLTEVSAIYSAAIEQLKNVKSEEVFAAQQDNNHEQLEVINPIQSEAPNYIETKTEPEDKQPEQIVKASVSIPESYVVQAGDNLLYISNFFYGTNDMIDAIMELNGITDPNKINFGMEIKLPRIVN